MSFPCGTISASPKLPFPGDFCWKEGGECPRITLRSLTWGWGPGAARGYAALDPTETPREGTVGQ